MSRPIVSASIWSTDMPLRMSAPRVFRGWTPVSQLAPARAWSPGPSPSASPLRCARPLTTSRSSRKGATGISVFENPNSVPTAAGVQSCMITPFAV